MGIALSRGEYEIETKQRPDMISRRLENNTLIRQRLIKERTDKQFLGQVNDDDFYLVSTAPAGVLCILEGTFEMEGPVTRIIVKSKMHRAFLILFGFWIVGLIGVTVFFYLMNPGLPFPYLQLGMLLLAAVGVRVLMHFVYSRARKAALARLEALFK